MHKHKALEIEFFRFFFSVVVVLRHSKEFLGIENTPFAGGALAVEFFFIVSGYLLAASALKPRESGMSIGQDTARYLGRKLGSFYPEFFVSWCVAFAVTVFAKGFSLRQAVSYCASCIWELLLLLQTGLRVDTVNSVVWYLSAMLLCMAVLYPLLRKYPNATKRVIAPVVTVLIFGFLMRNYKHLRDPSKWLGFAYKGLVRGMAELCLGIVLYGAVQKLSQLKLTFFARLLLTVLKWACYLFFILYIAGDDWGRGDFVYTLVIAVAVGISFSGVSLDAPLFNNPVVQFLGKLSLPLYLSHYFYADNLDALLPGGFSNNEKLLVYLTLTLVTALFVMAMAKLLRKFGPGALRRIQRCLIASA